MYMYIYAYIHRLTASRGACTQDVQQEVDRRRGGEGREEGGGVHTAGGVLSVALGVEHSCAIAAGGTKSLETSMS
jgi:hypothetical protein